MLETIVNKSLEIFLGFVLQKLAEYVLTTDNLKRTTNFLKIQILILYLDWMLFKTPLNSPPNQPQEYD
jgi:hypothetical protein